MTETNLKPCPFCGGEAKCIEFYGLYHVICCNCHIAGKDCPRIESAVSAWNTRKIEDDAVKYEPTSYSCRACKNATDEEIKRLREALEVILDEAQKDEPCVLAIKVVAYTALKGDKE